MKTAIITGASSGLGREYFRVLTKIYPDVEEFWLIARRENRLKELAESAPHAKCLILPLDLTEKEGIERYRQTLEEKKPEAAILVSNAGFGKLGDAVDIPLKDQTDMIALNCASLTAVTLLTVPYMQKGSVIIEVASIAAFAPTPRMTVYSATKAYVLSFSKGLRRELKDKGINVLAVCPGPMETEFTAVADIDGRSKMFASLPRCDVSEVAYRSVIKARKGKGVYIHKTVYKIYRVLTRLLPDSITAPKL